MSDPILETGAAPETHRFSFLALLFAASAAPIFWLGQVVLSYGVTAFACYPGDHPVILPNGESLRAALIVFDVIALIAALAGGLVALRTLRRMQQQDAPTQHRIRFLALWGIFSSLCFFGAILFNIIASVMVPLCAW